MKVKLEKKRIVAYAAVRDSERNERYVKPVELHLDPVKQEHDGVYIDIPDVRATDVITVVTADGLTKVNLVLTHDDGREVQFIRRKGMAPERVEYPLGIDISGVDNDAAWEKWRTEAEADPEQYFMELQMSKPESSFAGELR